MCFDQRGHGDSAAPGDGYTFDQLGHDLAEIIQQLGLNGVNILAHSSGGFASIIADYLQPGTIDRAVLVETRMTRRTQGSIGQERFDRTRQKQSVWESRDSFYQSYRSRSAFASWEEEIFSDFIDGCTKVLEDGRVELKCSPDVEAAYYSSRDDLDLVKYMGGLQGQYSLLLGDYPGGQTSESEGVRQFQKLVPGSEVKALGKGSHFLPMEFPELVLKAAREFFLHDRE
jgi:pimeloyl-ACP methyl ester carboxylesterase